jgi:hypothetical protein
MSPITMQGLPDFFTVDIDLRTIKPRDRERPRNKGSTRTRYSDRKRNDAE